MPGGGNPGQAAVLGLGLIGGSLAAGLRQAGWEVRGWSRRPEARRYALEHGIVDAVGEPPQVVAGAQLVILAGPPDSLVDLARACSQSLESGTVVTDVASVKEQVVLQVPGLLPAGVNFVGGHPLAGSERQGVEASSSQLLVGAPYILTWHPGVNWTALQTLARVFRSLGCQPYVLEAPEHDRLLAGLSHAPHVTAAALSLLGAGSGEGDLAAASRLAAGGFRDTTRVAGGDPALWVEIARANRENLLEALGRLQELLQEFRNYLEAEDVEGIERFLDRARRARGRIVNRGSSGGG